MLVSKIILLAALNFTLLATIVKCCADVNMEAVDNYNSDCACTNGYVLSPISNSCAGKNIYYLLFLSFTLHFTVQKSFNIKNLNGLDLTLPSN
jgi:hypothetical protein